MILLRQLTPVLGSFGPAWLRRWLVEKVPIAGVQKLIRISDTLHLKANELLRDKKAAVEVQSSDATKDIMSILCKSQQYTLMTLRRPSGGSRECSSTSKHGSIERGYTVR